MASAANEADDAEWELVNDDDFVYKRRKRRRIEPSMAAGSASALAQSDLEFEEKNPRERKKRVLVKLKEKYRQEILQWQELANILNDMRQKSPIVQHHEFRQLKDVSRTSSTDQVTSSPAQPGKWSDWQLVDKLLSQIQEAVLGDLSNLCGIAKTLCSAREEEFKKSFTELPIWASSPHELVASLCQD